MDLPEDSNERYSVDIVAIPLLKAKASSPFSIAASILSKALTVGFSSLLYFNSVPLSTNLDSPGCSNITDK